MYQGRVAARLAAVRAQDAMFALGVRALAVEVMLIDLELRWPDIHNHHLALFLCATPPKYKPIVYDHSLQYISDPSAHLALEHRMSAAADVVSIPRRCRACITRISRRGLAPVRNGTLCSATTG